MDHWHRSSIERSLLRSGVPFGNVGLSVVSRSFGLPTRRLLEQHTRWYYSRLFKLTLREKVDESTVYPGARSGNYQLARNSIRPARTRNRRRIELRASW